MNQVFTQRAERQEEITSTRQREDNFWRELLQAVNFWRESAEESSSFNSALWICMGEVGGSFDNGSYAGVRGS